MRADQAPLRLAVVVADAYDADRYEQFSRAADLSIVRFAARGEAAGRVERNARLRETIVARSAQHAEIEADVARSTPFDVSRTALVRLAAATPAYGEALRALETSVDACIVGDAALADLAANVLTRPLVYDAPRVEAIVPSPSTPDMRAPMMLAETKAAEARLLAAASLVLSAGVDDADALRAAGARDVVAIPTGIAPDAQRFRTAAARAVEKRTSPLAALPHVALFESDGSLEDALALIGLIPIAAACPGVVFIVTGPHPNASYPPNVQLPGQLSRADVGAIRRIADVAVAPHQYASQTKASIVAAIRAGLPVVAATSALRNLPLVAGRDVVPTNVDDFAVRLQAVLADTIAAEARAVSAYVSLVTAQSPVSAAAAFDAALQASSLRAAGAVR